MSNKKFYWLKLKDDFFDQDEIKIIEEMDNGKDYIIFYLKLLLKSVKTNGELRFRDTIPYSDKMLATITNVNVDIVRSAISVFIELGLIEKWDNDTLYMNEVINMTGSETSVAERVRKHRAKKKEIENQSGTSNLLQSNSYVTNSNTEIEKELETDKEKEIELEQEDGIKDAVHDQVMELVEAWNQIQGYNGIEMTKVQSISKTSARYRATVSRIKEHSFDTVYDVLRKVSKSDFLRGDSKTRWTADFGWVMRPTNFEKILEDTYINKNPSGGVVSKSDQVSAHNDAVLDQWLRDRGLNDD